MESEFQMYPLDSSFLEAAGYSGDTLRVKIKGRSAPYDLKLVPYKLFEGLLNASSHGTYFNQNLRGKFY